MWRIWTARTERPSAGSSAGAPSARPRRDRTGRCVATVRIPEDELVFEPGIIVIPHGGELELTLINDDKNTHCAVLPSNGDYQFIWLVNHSKGSKPHARRARLLLVRLRTGNDEGRGLTAAIVVQGDAPGEAKIDRPPQPQP